MKYFKQTIAEGTTYTVRSLEPQDVSAIVDYWINGNRDIFEKMGIDLSRFPSQSDREQFFLSLVDNDPRKGEAHLVVGLANNEIIGYALFNHIHPGLDCQGHLHIINPHFRRLGITSKLMIDHFKEVVEFLAIQKMYFEPAANNPGVNRLLQKYWIFPKKTFLKPAQGICREMEVNQYVITKRFILFVITLFRIKISLENFLSSTNLAVIKRIE